MGPSSKWTWQRPRRRLTGTFRDHCLGAPSNGTSPPTQPKTHARDEWSSLGSSSFRTIGSLGSGDLLRPKAQAFMGHEALVRLLSVRPANRTTKCTTDLDHGRGCNGFGSAINRRSLLVVSSHLVQGAIAQGAC